MVDFSYNEDDVLTIHVKEGDSKPYYLTEKGPKPGGTYVRVGRSKRQADDSEILTMIRDSSGWLCLHTTLLIHCTPLQRQQRQLLRRNNALFHLNNMHSWSSAINSC